MNFYFTEPSGTYTIELEPEDLTELLTKGRVMFRPFRTERIYDSTESKYSKRKIREKEENELYVRQIDDDYTREDKCAHIQFCTILIKKEEHSE